jgi:hypothetical protein
MNARILYAEDDPADADLTREALSEQAPEFQIDLVYTGEELLERVARESHDLILLDQRLPDLDGLEVLRRLRKRSVTTPVVIVTGKAEEELVIKALRLGAVEYITKEPRYHAAMPDILRRVLERERAAKLTAGVEGTARRTVLYVEPNEMDSDLTVEQFREEFPQMKLEVFHRGTEALQRLRQSAASYEAIIIDLKIPDLPGLELLRRARQAGVTAPFVVVTGKGHEEQAVAALRLGAYDYIIKRNGYLLELGYSIENSIRRFRAEQRATDLFHQSREVNQALREANANLDSFSHSVAHELRAPARAIAGFSDVLLEEFGKELPAGAGEYLNRIRSNALRMGELIERLLALAKFARQEPRFEPINVTEVVEDCLLDLRAAGTEMKVQVQLGMNCIGDRVFVQQIFQNLLSNAVKFSRGNPQGHVEVGCHSGAVKTFFVRDNGIGFSPDDAERLFKPFERMAGAGYEGTGVGLALVQRLVQKLGGRAWAEGEPRKGATFSFTLPCDRETAG